MNIRAPKILKTNSKKKHLKSDLIKWLKLAFMVCALNLSMYVLLLQPSLAKLLTRQGQQSEKLDQVRADLQKELDFYKEMRVVNEAKLFNQLAGLREELLVYRDDKSGSSGKQIEGKVDETLTVLGEWISGNKTASSSAPLLKGMVKINNPSWDQVEVYAEPRASAVIIGMAKYKELYFFKQYEKDWYQIDLENNKFGWIQAQFVEEIE